ncbi:hypothetical protein ACETU7_18495 [Rhodococcus sp. 3Y1]
MSSRLRWVATPFISSHCAAPGHSINASHLQEQMCQPSTPIFLCGWHVHGRHRTVDHRSRECVPISDESIDDGERRIEFAEQLPQRPALDSVLATEPERHGHHCVRSDPGVVTPAAL